MFAIFFASVLSVVSVVNTGVVNGGCDGGFLQDWSDTR